MRCTLTTNVYSMGYVYISEHWHKWEAMQMDIMLSNTEYFISKSHHNIATLFEFILTPNGGVLFARYS